MPSFRRTLSWLLVGSSCGLLLVTAVCFKWQPERLAAFTVMPIWLWGGLGLLLVSVASLLCRARLALLVTALWFIVILVGSDEVLALRNLGKSPPLPGPASAAHGRPTLRVITLNSSSFRYGDPTHDLAAWHPDIVLIQEAFPYQVGRLAKALFGAQGEFRCHETNGIITRWHIASDVATPGHRGHQATLLLPDGRKLGVVNIHLASAATDLRLWQRVAWRDHRTNRASRRQELANVLQVLSQTTDLSTTPTLFGGDFNSPASDPVHRLLDRDFTDAFIAAGTGWGDTFQRRVPILRIDRLYATRQLTPVRCRAVTTRTSDHRMVVADFLTP